MSRVTGPEPRTYRSRRLYWLAAIVLLAVPVRYARADVVTLPALEALALERRPALEAGGAQLRGSQAEVDKALSAYYPRISLEAGGTLAPGGTLATIRDVNNREFLVSAPRAAEDPNDPFAGGAAKPQVRTELGLQLKSSVFDFGRTSAAVDASRALAAATDAQVQESRQQIVRAVRGAYLGWLLNSELFAIAEHSEREAQARAERVQLRISEGVRPRSDLPTARAEALLARLELERARGELRASKLALEQAVGSPVPETAEPDRTLLEAEPQARGASRSATRVLELQSAAAAAASRAQAKLSSPLLSAGAVVGLRSQDDLVFPAYSVGLQFSWPLWDGGASSAGARIGEARAQELEARLRQQRELDQVAERRAQLETETANARLRTADELLQIVQERVKDAEQSYELGASDLETLASARTLLRRAQSEAVLARVARAQASLLRP